MLTHSLLDCLGQLDRLRPDHALLKSKQLKVERELVVPLVVLGEQL